MKIAGAVLIALGLVGLVMGGIPYRKTTNVAEFGDLKMQVKEEKQFTVPPIVSGIAILAGAAMMFGARSKPAG